MKLSSFHRLGPKATLLAGGLLAVSTLSSFAGTEEKAKLAKSFCEPEAPSRIHALFKLDFANQYVTPRGMIVRDQGLTIQPLFLTFVNLYKGESFINDFTMVLGVWNDFGTREVARVAEP